MSPAGHESVRISAGAAEAEYVPALGMVCASLRRRGEELLDRRRGLQAYAERGSTMGIPLLHPWANRLGGFSYLAAGQAVTLDPADPLVRTEEHGLPIHGAMPAGMPFSILEQQASRLRAALDWSSTAQLRIFPFAHRLELEAEIAPDRLSVTVTLSPSTDRAVPVAFGFHPYLRLAGPRAQAELSVPARERLVLDGNLLPTGAREPFREGPHTLAEGWDTPLAALERAARFAVRSGGEELAIHFADGFPFAQVFSPPESQLVCFEPMTAPADALRSGRDLPTVAPGTSFSARFSVEFPA